MNYLYSLRQIVALSYIYPVVMDVVEALELWDLSILNITSDGESPNRKFCKLCKLPCGPAVPYKTKNPYADRDLYLFCNPAHLIKTTRNCFSNSHSHSQTRDLQV